jgi:hypothetical protein
MRMVRPELGRVLDDHQALRRRAAGEEGRQQRGLARSGAAAHDERHLRIDEPFQPARPVVGERASRDQLAERERTTRRDAQGKQRPRSGQRRKDCMQSRAIG